MNCPKCNRQWSSGRICPYCDCPLEAGSPQGLVVPRMIRAIVGVETALVAMEDDIFDEGLRREAAALRETFSQRRLALQRIVAARDNEKLCREAGQKDER